MSIVGRGQVSCGAAVLPEFQQQCSMESEGEERGKALKTTLAVTKLERICTIYLRTG